MCPCTVARPDFTHVLFLQAAYNAIPYALSPVLGNPLALAAVNVDRSAPLPTQVSQASFHSLSFPLSFYVTVRSFLLHMELNCNNQGLVSW